VHGTDLRVRASVGIALGAEALGSDVLSADGDAEQAAEDLLRFADVAMYAAKHGGKGHHVLFEPDMHRRAQERRTLEHDLREAVDGGQLRVHYQPIVRLDTGETVAAEALVRWQHPTRGMVSPSDFIPLAEHTGLVASIGKWVLEAACRDAASWRADAAGRGAPRVTVNVSAAQLQRSDLVADVSAALTGAGLEPGTLTLEITETAMLADNDGAVVARLAELQALGVSIALDDFGTGYSSLSYLQRLPLDVIKIDKTFVKGIGVSGHDPVLTRAIIALGGALGVRVVAEGIERPWQASALRALGCTLGQGHHFAHPLPADAFRRWLASSAVIPSGARNPDAAAV
jgi:EAL domain-containing protein (putative c-di-GMP-specific phosphodiesterase class I)